MSKKKAPGSPTSGRAGRARKKIAAAGGGHDRHHTAYSPGDQAVLVIKHRGKVYRSLVDVLRYWRSGPLRVLELNEDVIFVDYENVNYDVRSAFGGVISVRAESLRPGNILDRIAAALEEGTDL